MPSRSEHLRFAETIAERLGLDPTAAKMGALAPDADYWVGRHRKTLHNGRVVLALLAASGHSESIRGFMVGYASHLTLDFFTKPSRLLAKILRGFRP